MPVSIVVSTTHPTPLPHPGSSIPCSSLTSTDPLHARPAGLQPAEARAEGGRGKGREFWWEGQERLQLVQGKGASASPHTPFPQETLEATFSWTISFQCQWKLWEREGVLALPESASQTLVPNGVVQPPSYKPPPRRATAPSSRSHSHAFSASAGSGGLGGNDVMLFLCQVSFQLQFSPLSTRAGLRRSV